MAVFAGASSGCARTPQHIQVVVSVFPIYDLVRRIAGPDAEVTLLVPRGTAPRDWTPTAEATNAVAHAKVAIWIGLGLDRWMEKLVVPKERVLQVGDRVPTLTNEAGAPQPDVWMDPQRARLIVTAITEEMTRADGSHAKGFRTRAAELDAQLAALDHELEVETAPWKARPLRVVPQGLEYALERYGLHPAPDATPDGSMDPLGAANTSNYEELVRSEIGGLKGFLR
ncbi:MAG TPA: metal ABC transporter substrate-binding protein [Polyangiaceae bacterium]|jgi:zinc transport system substrate-binding protein